MEDGLIKEIKKLNKSEKLALVETLWDSIASDPEEIPLPDYQKTILESRLKTLDEDMQNAVSWNELKKNYM